MNSYNRMIKEEGNGSCDENPELMNLKVEIGDTWLHQPVWYSSQIQPEPTLGLLDQVEGIDELLIPSIHSCHICERRFVNRYSLLKHNMQHLKVRIWRVPMYQCDDCFIYFVKKNLLEMHQVQTHLYDRNKIKITKIMHTCEICSKMYSYKSWHHHMSTVHSKKMEKCTLCDKTFKSLHYLRNHLKYVHKGHKPHWRFRTAPKSVNLKIINCTLCDKAFNHPYSLKIHMKNVHPSEGSQKCDICGSILKSASYLRAHKQRVHYDDGRKHYCNICGKDYKSPRYVRVHMRNAHEVCTDRKKVNMENYHMKKDIKKTDFEKGNVNDKADTVKFVTKNKFNINKEKSWKVVLDKDKKKSREKEKKSIAKENVALNIHDEYFKEEPLQKNNMGNAKIENEFVAAIFGTNQFGNGINENLGVDFKCCTRDYIKKEVKESIFDNVIVDADKLQGIKNFKVEEITESKQEKVHMFNEILDKCLQFENT